MFDPLESSNFMENNEQLQMRLSSISIRKFQINLDDTSNMFHSNI